MYIVAIWRPSVELRARLCTAKRSQYPQTLRVTSAAQRARPASGRLVKEPSYALEHHRASELLQSRLLERLYTWRLEAGDPTRVDHRLGDAVVEAVCHVDGAVRRRSAGQGSGGQTIRASCIPASARARGRCAAHRSRITSRSSGGSAKLRTASSSSRRLDASTTATGAGSRARNVPAIVETPVPIVVSIDIARGRPDVA